MSYAEMNGAKKRDVWFLDSGYSNHMCGDKSLFTDLNEGFKQEVKLGNNMRMDVLGKGNVRLQVSGFTHVVSEVFFLPKLKNNLLSIGQLQEKKVGDSHPTWNAQDLSSRERAHNTYRDVSKSDVCVASKIITTEANSPLHIHTRYGTFMALSLWTFELQGVEDYPV